MSYVFVYGTLKRGHSNHNHYLGQARFVGAARTEPLYVMRSLGGFPGVTRGGTTAVTGEIFEVTNAELANLDRLEGHPDFYRRQLISVSGILVYAYLLPEDFFEERSKGRWSVDYPSVDNGVW